MKRLTKLIAAGTVAAGVAGGIVCETSTPDYSCAEFAPHVAEHRSSAEMVKVFGRSVLDCYNNAPSDYKDSTKYSDRLELSVTLPFRDEGKMYLSVAADRPADAPDFADRASKVRAMMLDTAGLSTGWIDLNKPEDFVVLGFEEPAAGQPELVKIGSTPGGDPYMTVTPDALKVPYDDQTLDCVRAQIGERLQQLLRTDLSQADTPKLTLPNLEGGCAQG